MKRFLILTKANMLMNMRNRTTLFWNFAFPIGLIVLYGVIWPDAISWLAAGIVVLNLMSSGMLGDATRLTDLRERGVLRRVRQLQRGQPAQVAAMQRAAQGRCGGVFEHPAVEHDVGVEHDTRRDGAPFGGSHAG